MKIALGIEYDGSAFAGWQRQKHAYAVQQAVEEALAQVAQHDVKLFCAGRTDARVHATGQVVHFETESYRPDKAWVFGCNSHLPASVRIKWAQVVDESFHARFSAQARRYCYVIANTRVAPAILQSGLTWFAQKLDADKMYEAAQYFLGEQDFSSVQAAACQSEHANRNIHHLNVYRLSNYVVVDIQANAFLLHMVRNIVGILLAVGSGKQPPEWARELLLAKDRTLAPATASPNGLYLMNVVYPEHYQIPQNENPPLLFGLLITKGA